MDVQTRIRRRRQITTPWFCFVNARSNTAVNLSSLTLIGGCHLFIHSRKTKFYKLIFTEKYFNRKNKCAILIQIKVKTFRSINKCELRSYTKTLFSRQLHGHVSIAYCLHSFNDWFQCSLALCPYIIDNNIDLKCYIVLQINHIMARQKSVTFFFLINLCVVLCVPLPWTYKQTGETGTFYDKVKLFFSV